MLDFGRIGDMVSRFLGGAVTATATATASSIAEVLERSGIDSASLAGLNQVQIIEMLQQHGVNASLLEAVDINAVADAIGRGEGLHSVTEILSQAAQR